MIADVTENPYWEPDETLSGRFWRNFVNRLPMIDDLHAENLKRLIEEYVVDNALRDFARRNLGKFEPRFEIEGIINLAGGSRDWRSNVLYSCTFGLYELHLIETFISLNYDDIASRLRHSKKRHYCGALASDPRKFFLKNVENWMAREGCPFAHVESLYEGPEWTKMQEQLKEHARSESWRDIKNEVRSGVIVPDEGGWFEAGVKAMGTLLRIERFRNIVRTIWSSKSPLQKRLSNADLSFLNQLMCKSTNRLTEIKPTGDHKKGSSVSITRLCLKPNYKDPRNSLAIDEFLDKLLAIAVTDFAVNQSASNLTTSISGTGVCPACGQFFEKDILAHRKTYCSVVCKGREAKRRQRARKKAELHRRLAGI